VTSKEETNQMTDRIKTLLLVAFATISIAGAAHAGVVCNVRDTAGNNLTYAFGENSHNGNGSFGGTMVETGFEKNGQMVISEKGVRPIWIYAGNVGGGYDLYSRANPGWVLSVTNSAATLGHNGRFAGSGSCTTSAPASTASNVGDQGL
jgi:hypothetical protein